MRIRLYVVFSHLLISKGICCVSPSVSSLPLFSPYSLQPPCLPRCYSTSACLTPIAQPLADLSCWGNEILVQWLNLTDCHGNRLCHVTCVSAHTESWSILRLQGKGQLSWYMCFGCLSVCCVLMGHWLPEACSSSWMKFNGFSLPMTQKSLQFLFKL